MYLRLFFILSSKTLNRIQRIINNEFTFVYQSLIVLFVHFLFQPEEKGKFDGIFESLAPVSGLLSGDKVKPVLINSKLPLDVLGKVWDLSDIDKDGHLDRDEFAVVRFTPVNCGMNRSE